MHDYTGGKADWAVHGLPTEGRLAGRRHLIEVARRDIPTCGPTERLGDVRERVQAAGQELCIVVNDRGIVLGWLRQKAWASDPDLAVEDVMELGPPTDRPDPFLHETIERLRKVGIILVTQYGSEEDGGRLLGVLFLEDAERILEENERLPADS